MARKEAGVIGAGLPVRTVLQHVAEMLDAAGVESARGDARRLVADALNADSLELLRAPDRSVSGDEAHVLAGYVARRAAREPVSRILGSRGFYGREFAISPATLDPRPCTETVIEAVLEVLREEGRMQDELRILDVGTGSGCLVVTLLAELPQARGLGTDVSPGALDIAWKNAVSFGVSERFEVREVSYLDGIEDRFDLLVSNPPYIAHVEIADLEPEVRCFDPMGALDGGQDGLAAYRAMALGLKRVVPSGWAFFEVGAGQADQVAEILRAALGTATVMRVWNDLGGHQRCVAVKTQSDYP